MLIPFASVDPHKGKAGANECGVRGFKFRTTIQGFFPNDSDACRTVSGACAEEGVITLCDTEQTGAGPKCAAEWTCGRSIQNRRIWTTSRRIFRTCGSYWRIPAFLGPKRGSPSAGTSRMSIATHPAGSILKRKMHYGSDWPAITLDRRVADFEAAPFKDEVLQLILKESALRVLGETG